MEVLNFPHYKCLKVNKNFSNEKELGKIRQILTELTIFNKFLFGI